MPSLLLALILAGPGADAAELNRGGPNACSAVLVLAVDPRGREYAFGAASARGVSHLVMRAARADDRPLVFDVFTPRGQLYQALLASSPLPEKLVRRSTSGLGRHSKRRFKEAKLALAGSSIPLASIYGRWRVVPRFEGESEACGAARAFLIRP
ncbi:MAG TPA: hypothetical protein VE359_02730 [Vicinamibacteria bacterium]|nr:hypothetical protein [Vicinamibacteria bacterium]